jgi:glycerophosphoryl diester phosphodiesterase
MKVIGHRGAAGLALENTRASILAARKAGVDAIEIDVRLTADQQFVVCHDPWLRPGQGHRLKISDLTLAELQAVTLRNNESPINLSEALELAGDTPLLVEAKASGWAELLAKALAHADPAKVIVIARDQQELHTFNQLAPAFRVYLIQRFNPIDVLQALEDARRYGFTGVDLNFWLLNPLTYLLARRYELEIIVYTVNFGWIARFLTRLFPGVIITTNHPHRMQFLRTSDTVVGSV